MRGKIGPVFRAGFDLDAHMVRPLGSCFDPLFDGVDRILVEGWSVERHSVRISVTSQALNQKALSRALDVDQLAVHAALEKGGLCIQSQLAFCRVTPVTIDAMGLKNGPDLRLEMVRRDPFLSVTGNRRKSHQHRETPNQMEVCPRKVSRHFGFLVQRKKLFRARESSVRRWPWNELQLASSACAFAWVKTS